MQKTLWTAIFASVLGLAGAHAAGFSAADANGDGAVSAEEFTAAYPDLGEEAWNAADTNADGSLSEKEHQAAIESGVLPES